MQTEKRAVQVQERLKIGHGEVWELRSARASWERIHAFVGRVLDDIFQDAGPPMLAVQTWPGGVAESNGEAHEPKERQPSQEQEQALPACDSGLPKCTCGAFAWHQWRSISSGETRGPGPGRYDLTALITPILFMRARAHHKLGHLRECMNDAAAVLVLMVEQALRRGEDGRGEDLENDGQHEEQYGAMEGDRMLLASLDDFSLASGTAAHMLAQALLSQNRAFEALHATTVGMILLGSNATDSSPTPTASSKTSALLFNRLRTCEEACRALAITMTPDPLPFVKYPRTSHLFDVGGTGVSRDDLVLSDADIKVDMYFFYTHSLTLIYLSPLLSTYTSFYLSHTHTLSLLSFSLSHSLSLSLSLYIYIYIYIYINTSMYICEIAHVQAYIYICLDWRVAKGIY